MIATLILLTGFSFQIGSFHQAMQFHGLLNQVNDDAIQLNTYLFQALHHLTASARALLKALLPYLLIDVYVLPKFVRGMFAKLGQKTQSELRMLHLHLRQRSQLTLQIFFPGFSN